MTYATDEIDIAGLIERYDWLFVDQFGVLRGDDHVYAGARDALAALRDAGRKVIVLSNSGRSGRHNAERLARMGIGPDLYEAFVTSGDVARALLSGDASPIRLAPGKTCLTISTSGDTALAEALGLVPVSDAARADLILIAGSQGETVSLEAYRAMLRPAAERGIVAVCTNPDLEKLTVTGTAPAAGAIAAEYEAMGGPVIRIGKPFRMMYEHAYALAGAPDRSRLACVGDSLLHDVKGAVDFGVDAVLTATGLSAGLDVATFADQTERLGYAPRWLMPRGFRP